MEKIISTDSPDVELYVRKGDLEAPESELKATIVLPGNTAINRRGGPVPAGSLTAVHSADSDGTYISISPNNEADPEQTAAMVSVNGLVAALRSAGWQGPFWTEVRADEASLRYRIFAGAGWTSRASRRPRMQGNVVLQAVLENEPSAL